MDIISSGGAAGRGEKEAKSEAQRWNGRLSAYGKDMALLFSALSFWRRAWG